MATLVRLMNERDKIVDETFIRKNDAEFNREQEFESILKAQAWYKGQRTRAYLSHLNKSAIAIQRRWRGYLGRKLFRQIVKEQVFIMKLNHYNALATKIQKVWRGYYVRKYVFNYYSRKKYLEALQIKNELVRQELADQAEQREQQQLWQEEAEEKAKLDYQARKHHHLLSTEVSPGIYNSPFQPYPDEMEFHLRNARPLSRAKEKPNTIYDPAHHRYDLPQLSPLPPVGPKPQGPFRDPREVQAQRYKPFQPSLRVATSFTSVEEARERMKNAEWVTRLNDNIFLPFTKKTYPYDPLLHTTSKYGHLEYGTKYYREEHLDKFVTPMNFQSVVPPIPIFEKLNDTYSQGQV